METMTMADAATPTIPVYRQQARQQAADRLTKARKQYVRPISQRWADRVCMVPPDQRPAVVGPGKRGRRE